jgi:3-dehydroquinate dehydratase-1
MTLVCVPITEANVEDALASIKKAKESGADLVELRLDYIGELDDAKIGDLIDSIEIPKIVTLRTEKDGGYWKGEENDRINLILTCLSFGAEYVDISDSTDIGWRYEISKACKDNDAKMIISHHNFEKTPPKQEMMDIIKNEFAAGANIAKIATMPKTIEDVANVLSVIEEYKLKGKDVIGVAMGNLGKMSRIMGPQVGSFVTYASLEKGKESAAGQLTVKDTKTILKILEIGSSESP